MFYFAQQLNIMLKKYTVFSFILLFALSNSLKEYGTFKLVIKKFENCKGPKRKDCCIGTAVITNDSTIIYDLLVKESIAPNKGKIVALSKGKEFLRLHMNKPCDHLFLRPLFQTMMNVTRNCVVLKGHYNFKVDIQEVAQTYYGGTFLFGNWTFKAVFYNDECNFSCSVVEVEMSPKTKTSSPS